MLVLAFSSGGCNLAKELKSARTDAEIQAEADAVMANFLGAIRIERREMVFRVQFGVSQGRVTLEGKTSEEGHKQALIDRMAAIQGITLVDQIAVLPDASLGERSWGIVKVPVLNLGDGPKSAGGSHTVTQARMGDILRLLEQQDGWYLAQMDDSYLGWVDPLGILACDKASLDSFWSGPVALVSAKTTEALDRPGGEPAFKTGLVQGSVLPVTGVEDEWTGLEVPGDVTVWVRTSDVTGFDEAKSVFHEEKGAEGVISTAQQYVGLPYLWGGTTSQGFDCSGLTQFAYKMNGYRLRRDADLQYEQGERVADRESLRAGDLVFFETYRKGPSHVGIYIGNSRYIQSGSPGLTVCSFDPSAPDYSASLDKAYLGARRIIK